jgi:hypothetical protein
MIASRRVADHRFSLRKGYASGDACVFQPPDSSVKEKVRLFASRK